MAPPHTKGSWKSNHRFQKCCSEGLRRDANGHHFRGSSNRSEFTRRSTSNLQPRYLDIWILGPLAACPDYQGPASYSHEPLVVVSMEARPTRLLSNAWRSRGNARASVCFSCFGKHLLCEFHFDDQPFPINEMDIRAVEHLLLTTTSRCILIGMLSWSAVVNVTQLC